MTVATMSRGVKGPQRGSDSSGLDDGGSSKLLTVKQAAEYLTVSERFIRRIRYENRIRCVKLGKHVRFRKEDLDAFIEMGLSDPPSVEGGSA
jgi:excisionase family DNA binding protein